MKRALIFLFVLGTAAALADTPQPGDYITYKVKPDGTVAPQLFTPLTLGTITVPQGSGAVNMTADSQGRRALNITLPDVPGAVAAEATRAKAVETAISQQVGPVGPAGATGPQGLTGPTGPAGTNATTTANATTSTAGLMSPASLTLLSTAIQPLTAPILTGTNFTAVPESGVTNLVTDLAAKATSTALTAETNRATAAETALVPPARVITAPTRTFVTTAAAANGYQLSTTRDALVSYSVTVTTTATVGGAAQGSIVLEMCPTNSATAANWVMVGTVGSGQTFGVVVGISCVQVVTSPLNATIPAGYFVRLRTISTSGSPTFAYAAGQETLL